MPPLLWKKAKVAKIAKLVCDLGRKRSRSPLVVQTGFPTSLADIIVKNSSRLKKTPPTKNVGFDPSVSAASSDSQDQIPDSAPCDDGRRVVEAREASPAPPVLAGNAGNVGNVENAGVTGPACFTTIAKVLMVVVLALGTKELAVAITASAFVLFCLEFIGKRWFFPSKPADAASLALNAGIREGRDGEVAWKTCVSKPLDRQRSLELPGTDLKRKHTGVPSTDGMVSLQNVAHHEGKISGEIQAIESDLGLHRKQRNLELDPMEWKREDLPSKDDMRLAGGTKKRTQKMGSKKFMEKFLKKLRHKKRRKSHKLSSDDFPTSKGEEVCEEEEGQDDEDGEIFSSDSFCNDVMEEEEDEEDEDEEDVAEESVYRIIPWDTGHLVFLAIVLLGLIGGRGVALALTLSSLVVVKAVQSIWGRLKMSPTDNHSCG